MGESKPIRGALHREVLQDVLPSHRLPSATGEIQRQSNLDTMSNVRIRPWVGLLPELALFTECTRPDSLEEPSFTSIILEIQRPERPKPDRDGRRWRSPGAGSEFHAGPELLRE